MKTKKLKRLWNGLASLRDHEVNQAIKDGGIVLEYNGKKMTLTPEKLKASFSVNIRKFISKFNGKEYSLCDYRWSPDDKPKNWKDQLKIFSD